MKTWAWAWAFDILVGHMESTLHSEHGESYRDLALHDAHVRNKKARVHLQELGMGRNHKGPFAADLRV